MINIPNQLQNSISPLSIEHELEHSIMAYFLDALASLDLKLSLSEWVIYRFSNYFKASASMGLSDYLVNIAMIGNTVVIHNSLEIGQIN